MERLQAQADFDASRRRAFWHEVRAVLSGKSRTLLSFNEVVQAARMTGQIERGMQEIPLNRIRGSEGRSREFDAYFLPLSPRLKERWTRVETLMLQGKPLPPIEVYKVDDIYFVKDGHHRVSVARRFGQETIDAHVIEVRTRAPLPRDVDTKELLRAAEYASFLERTQLDRLRPAARLDCRELGHYDLIFEHILGHRYFMSLERGHEVPLPDAVADWYDSVYRPVMEVVRRHRTAEHLPDWTEADLYLAVTRCWLELGGEGQSTGPEVASAALAEDAARKPAKSAVPEMVRRWVRQHIRRAIVLRAARRPHL